jgi:pyrroline-5-carboxylate reductase
MKIIGIIGYGNMGSAFCKGLADRGKTYELLVSEQTESRARRAETEGRLRVVGTGDLVGKADIIVIAVKPQELPALISEIKGLAADKKIISVVAGKKTEYFIQALGTKQVVRFMPNLAASAGCAAVGIAPGPDTDTVFRDECIDIARAIGTPYQLSENLMPAITGLSGSGIAFVFSFVHALALGGVQSGLKYDEALKIAISTLEGAVAVLGSSGSNPIEYLSKVISPAGTTIKGVWALEEHGFTNAVIKAVCAAAERAGELEA